jgi:hypothetical protein
VTTTDDIRRWAMALPEVEETSHFRSRVPIVINHVTLDGVMQVPGRPGEDARDGFTHVGWNGAVRA